MLDPIYKGLLAGSPVDVRDGRNGEGWRRVWCDELALMKQDPAHRTLAAILRRLSAGHMPFAL